MNMCSNHLVVELRLSVHTTNPSTTPTGFSMVRLKLPEDLCIIIWYMNYIMIEVERKLSELRVHMLIFEERHPKCHSGEYSEGTEQPMSFSCERLE